MPSVVEIAAGKRTILEPLFSENRYDTVLMNSVLEGHFGTAHADSAIAPLVARLDSGAFTVLGGDPKAGALSALLRHKPIAYVTPETGEWRRGLESEFGDRVSALPFNEFSSESLRADHLKGLCGRFADGFELARVDGALARRLPSDLKNEYFFENFESVDDFLQRGLGYCVLRRRVVVSAATSMAMCRGAIDIEIETAPGFQRRGLGTAVGARLVLECLSRGIEPRWLAANSESEGLARKLGYVKTGSYETLKCT